MRSSAATLEQLQRWVAVVRAICVVCAAYAGENDARTVCDLLTRTLKAVASAGGVSSTAATYSDPAAEVGVTCLRVL